MIRTALSLTTALLLTSAGPAEAHGGRTPDSRSARPTIVAIIGDTPYGDAQLAGFPDLVHAINDAPKVDRVVHVGDIKNGSSLCSDSYFSTIAGHFAGFADPLVYTPGDNEWTDCHRAKQRCLA